MDENKINGWALTSNGRGVRKVKDATFIPRCVSWAQDRYRDAKGIVPASRFFESRDKAIETARKNCEDALTKAEKMIVNAKSDLEKLVKLEAQPEA